MSSKLLPKFGPFQILFPGDLETPAWEAHLRNAAFIAELRNTTILVASHHGRENGFCQEAFAHLRPQAVVISDKPVIHDTQEMVPRYRRAVIGDGIRVTNEVNRRHVLTTRCDGDILFRIEQDGNYTVTTHA